MLHSLVDNNIVELAAPQEANDKRVICFYVRENGTVPAREFISNLKSNREEKQIAAKLMYYLKQYLKKGLVPKSPEHYVYYNEHDFFELKAYQGRLFCFYDDDLCIALRGYLKKSRKAPGREIAKVKDYIGEYRRRKETLA